MYCTQYIAIIRVRQALCYSRVHHTRTTHERHDVPIDFPPDSQSFLDIYSYVCTGHQFRTGVNLIREQSNMNYGLLLVADVLDVDRDILRASPRCHGCELVPLQGKKACD